MPTEARASALFLFAHPDDEFGVLPAILACLRRGQRVACAYLTTAPAARGLDRRRERESTRVLTGVGVEAADIVFAGRALSIADGQLPEQMPAAARWLRAWLERFERIELICVPAWEGGHSDHDALHAAALHALRERPGAPLRQYPLYHAAGCPAPFFKVLAPLPANGPVQQSGVGWRDRLRCLRLCLAYPSQWKTWLGLFPFVFLHYTLRGVQSLQAVAPARLGQRPHPGALYYERRKFYTWEKMEQQLRQLTASAAP